MKAGDKVRVTKLLCGDSDNINIGDEFRITEAEDFVVSGHSPGCWMVPRQLELVNEDEITITTTQWVRFKDHIFDDLATVVSVDDEGGGAFIRIKQNNEEGSLAIDPSEVEDICRMLHKAKEVVELINKNSTDKGD